jgi:hypothetical protein
MRPGLVRRALALVVLLAVLVSVVFAVPSLVGVRHDLTGAVPSLGAGGALIRSLGRASGSATGTSSSTVLAQS